MRILELSDFSAGGCGVWERVKLESLELSRNGHKVRAFSSNATKGSRKKASSRDKIGKVEIFRFPYRKLGGESFMYWNFKKEAMKFRPEVVIAHSYRHPHTLMALKVAKKLGAKCFLVTHAPFVEKNITRSKVAAVVVNSYDKSIGKKTINKFDKIITISKWELRYLEKMGADKKKIVYIPNGLPKEFFKKTPKKRLKQLLFFGRIAPIKNLEVAISALADVEDVKFDIAGPPEEKYLASLKNKIKKLKLGDRIKFLPKFFNLNEKISLMDKYEFFILPSKREAQPQTLLEAMSRGVIPITSATEGGREIVVNRKNGFVFSSKKGLVSILKKINTLKDREKKKLSREAVKSASGFKTSLLTKKLEKLF